MSDTAEEVRITEVPPTMDDLARIDARGIYYRDLNNLIRAAVRDGAAHVELVNINGQRYIGDGLQAKVRIDIHGVPGNDLAAFMDGADVFVHNNAQDAVGNTLNSGRIAIDGDAGDVVGYGMRGGKIFVRGDVGYRVGIHMKEEAHRKPLLVVGGTAADFLGEYMAGGALIVLGLNGRRATTVGDYCGTGMHGGAMYLHGDIDPTHIATKFVARRPADEADMKALDPAVREFCELFGHDADALLADPFWVVKPTSHKPFASNYAANP
jgi:glutamate synthase domain-containing protein 3